MSIAKDKRVVMTLDAGGTSLRFAAMRGGRLVTDVLTLPSQGDDLDRCLASIYEGFKATMAKCPARPVAISFAFPGPADYPRGIIGDLFNLPGFRGGVALGPFLQAKFRMPTYINNDGDLFTYGEAIAGFLPEVNAALKKAGSPKRFKNLVGVTLGTGFGGGIVRDGELFGGDNSMAGEVWLLRSKPNALGNAEEFASIRAVRRVYAERTGTDLVKAPDPKEIHSIARGTKPGDQQAAVAAFDTLGANVGDALAQVLTLTDSLAVIGGGISASWRSFLPAVLKELNSSYVTPDGRSFRRLTQTAYNFEDRRERARFLKGKTKNIVIPHGRKKIAYDSEPRLAVGISRLGTSEAIAMGAYAFALNELDRNRSTAR
jgi:glucokinase